MLDQNDIEYIELKGEKKLSAKFWKIAIIIICFMAVVSLLTVYVYLSTIERLNPEETVTKDSPPKEDIGVIIPVRENLKICIEKETLDGECSGTLLGSEVYLECEGLKELKDKCLYSTAIVNGDVSLCPLINDSSWKSKCEKEVTTTGEI